MQLSRGAGIALLVLSLVTSMAGCVEHREPWPEATARAPLGCAGTVHDFEVAQRLAIVGEKAWCEAHGSGPEEYRLIWGHRTTPTVITLVPAGDSAVLHAVGIGHVDERGRRQRPIDTTVALSHQAWESYRHAFADAARRAKVVSPPSDDPREPSIWMVEGRRLGSYQAMVGWSGRHVRAAHVNAFYWLARPAGLWSRFTGVY